ncbi:MAG: penicillin-binding protein 1B [Chromatiales bacterium]|nr:penicillin-binding protein 1B [Chromatiales bacterium]
MLITTGVAGVVAFSAYVAWLDYRIRDEFEGARWAVPARVFARPLELAPGAAISADAIEAELKLAGYRQVRAAFRPASFERDGERIRLVTREFRFPDGTAPSRRVTVSVSGGRIADVAIDGGAGTRVLVDPAEIARVFPAHREDRLLLRLDDVPVAFLAILMEVEDRRFYRHVGIDPLAIARAAWANLRAGRTVQGGSTLTQQLAKNFFLSSERTFTRKLNEALIALLLEWRYSKPELLEGYLNEVYLGQQGAHAIHGFGRAARHWFGRGLADLDLDEMALLAGLVSGPSYYDPRRHPERAMQRRNRIIDRLEARGVAGPDAAARARREPLGVTRHPPPASARFPAFIDLVRRQLRRDYPGSVLRSEGLRIFTTLDPTVQRASESALDRSLPLLARRSRITGDELQAAIAVTDARSGEVLSIVGDRDPRRAGFNRALDAVRPVGSVVKPAVYLAALTEPQFHLASFVRDDPVQVDGPRGPWRPRNHDGRAHGPVLLRDALVHSYNLATVRLGLDVGLERVRDTIRALGVSRPFATFPAMLLGTVELAPIEVNAMYHSLATGGLRQPLRAIRSVTDRQGRSLGRYPERSTRVADSDVVFLVTHALRGVLSEGTGRRAREILGRGQVLAGKTGTTDGLRDSWFAGYGADRVAVVWVGRDDNRPVNLSGASGALEVWARLMRSIGAASISDVAPRGVEWHWVSRDRGRRIDGDCAAAMRLPFAGGRLPPEGRCGAQTAARGDAAAS